MYDKLEIMRMAQSMAVHASARQGAVAQNIANADTPGYRARDVAPFEETYESKRTFDMKGTRDSHIGGVTSTNGFAATYIDSDDAASPNGNTVSLELEMVKSVETQAQHDKALAIYKSSLDVIRASLGKL